MESHEIDSLTSKAARSNNNASKREKNLPLNNNIFFWMQEHDCYLLYHHQTFYRQFEQYKTLKKTHFIKTTHKGNYNNSKWTWSITSPHREAIRVVASENKIHFNKNETYYRILITGFTKSIDIFTTSQIANLIVNILLIDFISNDEVWKLLVEISEVPKKRKWIWKWNK